MAEDHAKGTNNALSTLVISKLGILKQEEQLIVKLASAIGDELSASLLEAIVPQRFQFHLRDHIDNLISYGFLKYRNEVIYFQNVRIRTIIYQMLPARYSRLQL